MRTGRKKIRGNALAWLQKAMPVVYFLFVFFLYWSLLSEPYFTDEQDVFYGAYHLAKGREIYRSFLSQHMPFSYYLVAPIALCGARTVFQFRLGIYGLLTAGWEGLYLRHRRTVHPAALFVMPLLYLAVLKTQYMGTTMLSEHWQGLGLVMILLELVRFTDTKEITLSCAGWVAAGILLSFGTAFISAYPLFCFFLAVLAVQAAAWRRARKAGRQAGKDAARRFVREDLRLAGLSLLPFALLGGWYLASGNLGNFYEGAYEIVTTLYPKYIGGLGSDPLRVFWETVGQYGAYLGAAAGNLAADPAESLITLGLAAGLLVFSVRLGRKSPAVGILVFLAAVYGGIRGFSGFHAMA